MEQHLATIADGVDAAVSKPTVKDRRRRSTHEAGPSLSPEICAAIQKTVKRPYVVPTAESFSIDAFCARYGIGRPLAYDEINAGRLKMIKRGGRTLIRRV